MSRKKESQPIEETEIPNVGIVKAGFILDHPKFGHGEVKEIAKWTNGDITICIAFEHYGSKWLVPEYAQLREPKQQDRSSGLFSSLFGKKH